MKQTAVEWLVEQITNGTIPAREAIQQAKAMELEKLKEAYSMGRMNKSIKEFNITFKSE